MESLESVEKEVEKVLSKFAGIDENIITSLEEIIEKIGSFKRKFDQETFDENGTTTALDLKLYLKQVKEVITKLSLEHKDLHATVSKIGKTIDKNFMSDFHHIFSEKTFDSTNFQEIAQVISDHFLQHGLIDVANSLAQEAELDVKDYNKEPYLQLYYILEALKNNNFQPALEWVDKHREELQSIQSMLEFKIHRLQFIAILRKGFSCQTEAIRYAHVLAPFAERFIKDIQVLMGSLLYLRQGLDNSPYAFLLMEPVLEDVIDTFMKDSCKLLGLPAESPLSTVMQVGCITLPPLLALNEFLYSKQLNSPWTVKEELPFFPQQMETELGKHCRYHSVFACPILRQTTTVANPPVRLVCGHIISKDALSKLATMNKWGQLHSHPSIKVKCPYCPKETLPSDAKQIYF
ncbi:hypothetical protein HELRODRAFT_185022 [Helobdella robusta]|uniref:RING-Gid-type domain-containing protein n=1 Tax=Helobdella robusta TaxID=6412 RepID=T1FMA7_HELRO|nr:hypothetical protein HELRODRAFT_185022 [Helobdella robusta]ESN98643.1 hypothetical protein HELRODRAFT_185022 [Helobdella robusta]